MTHATPAAGLLVVLTGPSGVGKGTVDAHLRRRCTDAVASVSVTTRPPRSGERDGVEYHFVDRQRFAAMAEAGELLEWAEYAGNLYGTPRDPVRRAVADGRVIVLEIEVQGALQVKAAEPAAVLVFISPPSFAELERRLRARGTEAPDVIARRLQWAREELAERHRFDAEVVNDDADACAERVCALIRRARARAGARRGDDVGGASEPGGSVADG